MVFLSEPNRVEDRTFQTEPGLSKKQTQVHVFIESVQILTKYIGLVEGLKSDLDRTFSG